MTPTSVVARSDHVVSVVAPATLEAGSTFEAEVDGITFLVTIPEDGVTKGCEFQVPYPDNKEAMLLDDGVPIVEAIPSPTSASASALALASSSSLLEIEQMEAGISNYHTRYQKPQQRKNGAVAFSVPTGQWRRGFWSCFEGFDCCVCLMGWFCSPIMMAQVMQRLRVNWFGCPAVVTDNNNNGQKQGQQQSPPPICIVYTVIALLLTVIGLIIEFVSGSLLQQVGYTIISVIGLYFVVVFTFARMTMRQRYNLPHTCCDTPGLDDCCSVYWCGCCSAIQMHRHTHDETKYRYNVISQTGLDGNNSPQITV